MIKLYKYNVYKINLKNLINCTSSLTIGGQQRNVSTKKKISNGTPATGTTTTTTKTTTSSRGTATNSSAANEINPESKIVIPKRIQRSPTAILNALSTTVGFDPTAAHYKYHDDPFLIPMSNAAKRTFAMAQESGRKAAKWIKEKHGDFFQHNEAEPPIKAFQPKQMHFTEDSEVDVLSLEQIIENGEVNDAILIYGLMQKRSIECPIESKQSLLELLCFYNHNEPLCEDFIEERWFRQSAQTGRDRQRKTWKDGQLAEQIFNELPVKDANAYSAIIRGMCKYFQCERAFALYQEALEKQLIDNVETCNAIITTVNLLKENGEMRWQLLQEILQTMKSLQIQPNLETLNACMGIVSTIAGYTFSRTYALRLLSEFKHNLHIEPSLTTWYYMLVIFCRERGPVSHVLCEIMNELDGRELQIDGIKDTFFFVTAMDVCRNHLNNRQLAERVHRLLHFSNNYDLIGDSYKESVYYRNYFGLMCSTMDTFDDFMQLYRRYVPNIYIPEPGIMSEILTSLENFGAFEYLPQLWSDMLIFDHINRENLLNQILKIMVDSFKRISDRSPSVATSSSSPSSSSAINESLATVVSDVKNNLNIEYTNIAWSIWQKLNDERELEKRSIQQAITWSGQLIGNILILCCRTNDFDKALQVFLKLDKEQHKIVGTPDASALRLYIQLCINEKLPSRAIDCLQYAVGNEYSECQEFAKLIGNSMTLDTGHKNKIRNLINVDIF